MLILKNLKDLIKLAADGNTGGGAGDGDNKPKTITLTETELESQIDKRVTDAIKKREATLNTEHQAIVNDLNNKLKGFEDGKLTAEQLLEQRQKEIDKQLNSIAIDRNKAKVERMFVKENIVTDDTDKIIDSLVEADETKSIEKAQNIIATMKAIVEKQIKEKYDEAVKKIPKPKTDDKDDGTMNKEKFDKMSYTEQLKFKSENPEEFKKFILKK